MSDLPSRRRLLALALSSAAAAREAGAASPGVPVANVTGLYTVRAAHVATPTTTDGVSALLRAWPGRVAVGGGRYSMGGQIAVEGGLHLDLRGMNRLLWLRPEARTVRVQAGMRWRDLQDHLDPLGLAVKTMQSFANFTVGGSVSVNAHGRYVNHGPVGHTVRALQIVLADGSVVEATRHHHADLFRAALGGYGAIGVVTEVELDLADNVLIERQVEAVPLAGYTAFLRRRVLEDPRAVMHNADLLPPDFDAPLSVTWYRAASGQRPTVPERLVPRGQSHGLDQSLIWVITELPGGAALRRHVVQPMRLREPVVKWLNHEASLDVAMLEPRTRAVSTYALQEYFVPPDALGGFVQGMAGVLRRRDVQALNVSIRHSPADRDALLPWAREEVCSLVLYHKQRTWPAARDAVGRWTRELIDLALRHGGRYYLPYQLHATQAQFEAAYPEAAALRRLKSEVDPQARLSNELWRRYL